LGDQIIRTSYLLKTNKIMHHPELKSPFNGDL
jgi:hypothetical protein